MKLVRYNPTRQLGFPRNFFSSFLEDPFLNMLDRWEEDSELLPREEKRAPLVNISENEKEYLISAELPGVEKKNLHVDVKDNLLTLSGERKEEHTEKKNGHRWMERSFGSFHRSFVLPEGANTEKINAKYENGLLNVTIPKAEPEEAKKVPIH